MIYLTRKRKLHPLCVMGFPEKKRVTFRLGEESTEESESESEEESSNESGSTETSSESST